MSNDCPRHSPARRRALFQVGGLENRALMSGIHGAHLHRSLLAAQQPQIQTLTLGIDASSKYISQQVSTIDVTITRGTASIPTLGTAGSQQNLSSLPLTVDFYASLGSTTSEGQPASLPASASDTFTPVSESITFPAGVATETVRLPVNSGAANPGSVPIELSVTSSSPNVDADQTVVYLVTGPSALPPTPPAITNAYLILNRKTVSGITITFSQPMAPASVENVHDYSVTTGRNENFADWFGLVRYKAEVNFPVPLKAARYDPTTNSVTLIPRKPLSASVAYEIQNATSLAQHTLTDAQGNALPGDESVRNEMLVGTFSFALKGHLSHNWPAPVPPTIFSGN
jgi:Big-like domain-containing protein